MVDDGYFRDAPFGRSGSQHHLEGPTEPPILDAEPDQAFTSRGAHRAEVRERRSRSPPQLPGENSVRQSTVQGPRATVRVASAEDEISVVCFDGLRDAHEVCAFERAVAIHEAHDVVGCGEQSGVARGAESASGLRDDESAVGARHLCGRVRGAVVHDNRPEARRQAREHPGDRLFLVECWENDVGHAVNLPIRPARFGSALVRLRRPVPRPVVSLAAVRAPATLGERLRERSTSITIGALAAWVILVIVGRQWLTAVEAAGPSINYGDAVPFIGRIDWHPSWRLLVPIVVAAATALGAPSVVPRLRWSALLVVAAAWSALWSVAVATVDRGGWSGLTRPLLADDQYLAELSSVTSLHDFVSTFAERATSYVAHVSSHPPGMVMTHYVMDVVGLSGAGWAAALCIAGGALAVSATMITVREVVDESAARRVAPFLAVAPTAIWIATTADAFYAGIATVAVMCVVLATGRDGKRSDGLAFGGGVLFGVVAFLSYGLPLLAAIPALVAFTRRRLRPLVVAAAGAALVGGAFAAAGFWWFDGLEVANEAYYGGVGGRRPYWVFAFVNWSILAAALGPGVAVGLARTRERGLWLLTGGAVVALVVAIASGYSKGEVERIWLPFTPWILVALGSLAKPWRNARGWIVVQAGYTIVLTTALSTPW